ncbi:MAG: hypothetical protein HOP30_20445 [Cyclobacteriaceae bacterium]|nr:hypothetical protein [Cyclobacteriaceae bacterium]
MKKFIFSLTFVVLVIGSAFSQDGKFSGGLELGLPLGTAADGVGLGFGLSGRYEAPIQDKLNWFATAGFISYSGKEYTTNFFGQTLTVKGSSVTMIPLQGGVKYYFQESDNGFYGSGELGLFIASGSGSSDTKFGITPGLGYRLEKFDLSARFNVVSDFNTFGIRAAYIF